MSDLFADHKTLDLLPRYADTGEAFVPGRDVAVFVHPKAERPPHCPGEGKLIRADRVFYDGERWVAEGTCYRGSIKWPGHYHKCQGTPESPASKGSSK